MSVVTLERDADGVAVVTFDAPPLNLFDATLGRELDQAIEELEADLPRAVLIRAEGRVVSGGVDVEEFAALEGSSERAQALFDRLLGTADRVAALPRPTVFAAHGLCLTWAFELALACDLIVAARSARFGLVERVVGLTPAMGGTQRLAERAGAGRAREFVMTGELYPAEQLERWNVVNRLLDDEGFHDAARDLARQLAVGPPLAHAATKAILDEYLAGGVPAANAATARIAGGLFETQDLRSAVRSFLDEGPGKARFEGR